MRTRKLDDVPVLSATGRRTAAKRSRCAEADATEGLRPLGPFSSL